MLHNLPLGIGQSLLGFTGRTYTQLLQGPPPDLIAIAFGLGGIAMLWAGKRFLPRVPTTMVLVALSAALSAAIGYALRGGAVIGALPSGLPSHRIGLQRRLCFRLILAE